MNSLLLLNDTSSGKPNTKNISSITIDEHHFIQNGKFWRYKGVTAFKLLELFSRGVDIRQFIKSFPQYNVLRIFLYTPVADWGNQAWDIPSIHTINDFIKFAADFGFYVEIVLLTDSSSTRITETIYAVHELAEHENLFIQIGNEPQTHKNIPCRSLQRSCELSGVNYSSGNFEDTRKFFGKYFTDHSAGDNEWPRKSKNLIEVYNGGGPNYPEEPAYKIPCIEDESTRPDNALNMAGGNERLVRQDYYTFAALASACGNGATFHFESGKYGNCPNDFEASCAEFFARGLNVFPIVDSRDYRRIDERGNTLRTYIFGNSMIRVRPITIGPPESGWKPLDEYGICFTK